MIYWNNEALGESWRGPGIPRPGAGLCAHGPCTAGFILQRGRARSGKDMPLRKLICGTYLASNKKNISCRCPAGAIKRKLAGDHLLPSSSGCFFPSVTNVTCEMTKTENLLLPKEVLFHIHFLKTKAFQLLGCEQTWKSSCKAQIYVFFNVAE